jgi:hypothetical protein
MWQFSSDYLEEVALAAALQQRHVAVLLLLQHHVAVLLSLQRHVAVLL